MHAMTVFNDNAVGALEFSVTWEKDGIHHEEWFLGRKVNPVNDIFPRDMRKALEGKREGDTVTFTYEPRLCIPRHREKLVRTMPMHKLRPKTLCGTPIIPRVGRFYPQGHINGIRDIYPDTLTPFRMIALDGDTFTADCNHPLANIPVTFTVTIQYLETRDTGTYGSLTHWREATCDWGPGMQAMLDGQPTDFYLPDFFDRNDETDTPFTPPLVDKTARQAFDAIAAQFITPDMRVLDLSSAPRPEDRHDAAFGFLCIEYMDDPITVLENVAARLRPGGPVVIGFSNHFDESRVIRGWTELHEFERMGLVLDYIRQAGLDAHAGTVSRRNDWRPKDDPTFLEMRGVSDPLYVVYGYKR